MSDSCVVANCKGWYWKRKKSSDKVTGQSEHLYDETLSVTNERRVLAKSSISSHCIDQLVLRVSLPDSSRIICWISHITNFVVFISVSAQQKNAIHLLYRRAMTKIFLECRLSPSVFGLAAIWNSSLHNYYYPKPKFQPDNLEHAFRLFHRCQAVISVQDIYYST